MDFHLVWRKLATGVGSGCAAHGLSSQAVLPAGRRFFGVTLGVTSAAARGAHMFHSAVDTVVRAPSRAFVLNEA